MSSDVQPTDLASRVADLEAALAVLQREKGYSPVSGNSAPKAAGPNFRDLADVSPYSAEGYIPRYRKATGLWTPEDLPYSTTVVSQFTFGQSSSPGSAATVSRGDHRHGTPSDACPAARVNRGSNQSIPNATATAISFDNTAFDVRDDGAFFSAGAPTRLTVPVGGWYVAFGQIGWFFTNAQVFFSTSITLNGVGGTVALHETPWPSTTFAASNFKTTSTIMYCSTGDYFELAAYQNSGAAINISQAHLAVARLGSLGY